MQGLITIPMVDIISEITGRAVVMKDTSYVFFDTKEVVDDATISEATLLKTKKELEIKKAEAKAEKEHKLATLTVTTSNGNTFDGNLEARTNMTSAILSADIIGKTEEYWKLADNTTKLIQLTELREALALAIQEVGNTVKDY